MDRASGIGEKEGWSRETSGRSAHGRKGERGRRRHAEEEFEGVGCRHRRGRRRFLLRCRRRRRRPPPPPPPPPPSLSPSTSPHSPSSCRRRFSTSGRQAGRLFPFFLLFPIIDKTETAQYRDDAPRRGVGKRSLSTTLLS